MTNLANNIPLSIWYDWHDDGTDPNNPEHNFGTVRFPYYAGRNPVYDAKPAYQAAQTLTTLLAGTTFSDRLQLGRTDDYALAFSDGVNSRFVAWTTSTAHAATLALPPGYYDEVSYLGTDLGNVRVDSNGLTLTLTDGPVYLLPLSPASPVNLAATAGNGLVTLSWAGVANADGYNVYRGTQPGGEDSVPIATGVAATAFTDTGLANDTTYYYLVTAVNAAGESSPSNEGAATPQPAAAFSVSINFSNNRTEVPTGYVNDIGLAFGDQGNGFDFGWNQDTTADARDRDNPNAPDERYDSFIHMQKPDNPNAFWRIAVPNGTYQVHVVAGDIDDNFDAVYAIAVQGTLAVSGTPTPDGKFFEGTVAVSVTNGFLTVGNAPGSMNNKIDCVDITQTTASGVDYGSGFAGANDLQRNGGAALNGTRLRLTDGGLGEARSAFVVPLLNVQTFTSAFSFQLINPAADGFTFTLQGLDPTALGESGGGLGYRTISRSVAIKFDLFDNAGEGPDSTGLYAGGSDPSVPAVDLRGTGIDLHSGDVFDVSLSYDGATLVVTIADETTGAAATQVYPIDIAAAVGGPLAYAGFTAGTGALAATQDILSWVYTPGGGTAPAGGARPLLHPRAGAGLEGMAFVAVADSGLLTERLTWSADDSVVSL